MLRATAKTYKPQLAKPTESMEEEFFNMLAR